MLVIQEINLTWHKEERGGPAATARGSFALARPLPENWQLHNVGLHCLNFYQQGKQFWDDEQHIRRSMTAALAAMGINEPGEVERRIAQRLWRWKKYESRFYQAADELNLANLALEYCGNNLAVVFCYDERRSGKPRRRGRNKDYHNRQSLWHGRDCLNEEAFLLEPGQYGRILWNERRTDYDTGIRYYQLHIYNILLFKRGLPPSDILLIRQPDYEYEQLADLY